MHLGIRNLHTCEKLIRREIRQKCVVPLLKNLPIWRGTGCNFVITFEIELIHYQGIKNIMLKFRYLFENTELVSMLLKN